jgi:hypothetical protein
MSAGYRIERLRLPPRLEGPEAEELLELSSLSDAVQRQIGFRPVGHDGEWSRSLQ